ncbi:hypothetical protein ACLMJK_005302 [Lecanora helva]
MPLSAENFRPPKSTIGHHTDTYSYVSPAKYAGTLTGKVVLITGAGRGIGRATALAFAAAGANVACLSRTRSDVEVVVEEIHRKGFPEALALAEDVVDPTAPDRVVKDVEASLGSIDVLINNAGISRISDIEHEESMSRAFQVMDVNLKGTMSLVHAAIPSMIARKAGIIINIVSVLAVMNLQYFSAYSAAKTGLLRATEIIDLEFRSHGICSYAVAPGMVADTTLGHGALNIKAHEKVEDLQRFWQDFGPCMTDSLALPADTLVALVADKDAKWMSGRYIDVTQDLGAILEEAKKGPEGRIQKEGLYTLKVDTL